MTLKEMRSTFNFESWPTPISRGKIKVKLSSADKLNFVSDLLHRIIVCLDMAEVSLKKKDFYGIHCIQVEIKAFCRDLDKINKL